MINRKGANGSPYLSPLEGENCLDGLPLMRIEIIVDSRHPLIQDTHLAHKLILSNI